MIAKEIDALNITLFNSYINFTNVHLCNYCTEIFVIVVNTCVCRRSVNNKTLILSYPMAVPPPPGGGSSKFSSFLFSQNPEAKYNTIQEYMHRNWKLSATAL